MNLCYFVILPPGTKLSFTPLVRSRPPLTKLASWFRLLLRHPPGTKLSFTPLVHSCPPLTMLKVVARVTCPWGSSRGVPLLQHCIKEGGKGGGRGKCLEDCAAMAWSREAVVELLCEAAVELLCGVSSRDTTLLSHARGCCLRTKKVWNAFCPGLY